LSRPLDDQGPSPDANTGSENELGSVAGSGIGHEHDVETGNGAETMVSREPALLDLEPDVGDMRGEVLAGLRERPKRVPSKYLYDTRGSELFDEICELAEYYPTRTELQIMERHSGTISQLCGPGCMVIEYGSGSSLKSRIVLGSLIDPVSYVPIDISRDHLLAAAREMAAAFPGIEILPVCADYTHPLELPAPARRPSRRVVFYPGSTIGNFAPENAAAFLRGVVEVVGPNGAMIVGVDRLKDRAILEPAYDDGRGVTAAFNKNLLVRLNRELDADFDLAAFRHTAPWLPDPRDSGCGRIEMRLISTRDQVVTVSGERFHFGDGERLVTEYSYKYTPEAFARLAASAGLVVRRIWSDTDELFGVYYLETAA